MSVKETVVIIPALNPGEKLLDITVSLQLAGIDKIIIVNDGSDPSCSEIFSHARSTGCDIIFHETNLGKGAALKSGIKEATRLYGDRINIITADADGQHKAEDVIKVKDALIFNTNKLVLGIRDFTEKNVPLRSRFGNKCTSLFFKLSTGVKCPDTQTGLRGIPASLISLALDTEGNRYEYEMNFLNAAAGIASFSYVQIETVYENGNSASHFRPVRDSILIYGVFLRFMITSLSGFAVDYSLFYILLGFLRHVHVRHKSRRIMIATIIARMISGVVNFALNKKYAFKSKGNTLPEMMKYLVLFFCQMGASAMLTTALSVVLPTPVAKVVTDSGLFFVSYIIQNRVVFREKSPIKV